MSDGQQASDLRAEQLDVGEFALARVYAQALWNLAEKEQGAQTEVSQELRSIVSDVLDREPALERFFSLGSIDDDHRQRFLDRVFRGRVSDLTYQFLVTLARRGRLGLLRAVSISLERIAKERAGKVEVLVKSARPLSAEQRTNLVNALIKSQGINPDPRFEVDQALLGGLWVRIGDRVFDRSVRTNLLQLKDNILARSSHEIQGG